MPTSGTCFFNMLGLVVFGASVEEALNSKRFLMLYLGCGIGAGLLYGLVHYLELRPVQAAAEAYLANPDPDLLVRYFSALDYPLNAQQYNFVHKIYPAAPENAAYIQQAEQVITDTYFMAANGRPMVGASGSIFGVMAIFGLLFPNMKLMLLFPPIPVKAKYLVLFYAAYSIYSLWQSNPGDNVAHLAHVGGMVFGFAFFKLWQNKISY